jgi:hypothetical protein
MRNKDTQNLEMIYENIFQKAGQALGFGKKPEQTNTPQQIETTNPHEWLKTVPNMEADVDPDHHYGTRIDYKLNGMIVLHYYDGEFYKGSYEDKSKLIPNNINSIKEYINDIVNGGKQKSNTSAKPEEDMHDRMNPTYRPPGLANTELDPDPRHRPSFKR